MIVAMAKNRVIGAKGKIPWHLPNELQLFKQVTMGHHIIMGRKTHESIGRLLPGRTTVIVTRQPDYAVPGAKIAHTLEQAVGLCAGDSEIFIIGGGEHTLEVSVTVMPRLSAAQSQSQNQSPAGNINS